MEDSKSYTDDESSADSEDEYKSAEESCGEDFDRFAHSHLKRKLVMTRDKELQMPIKKDMHCLTFKQNSNENQTATVVDDSDESDIESIESDEVTLEVDPKLEKKLTTGMPEEKHQVVEEQQTNTSNEDTYQPNHIYIRSRPRILVNGRELSEEESWANVPDQYKPKALSSKRVDFSFNYNKHANECQFPALNYKIIHFRDSKSNEPEMKKAELERQIKCKCREESDAYLNEVKRSIYDSSEGHPVADSEGYYKAAEKYAIYGESFLDFPKDKNCDSHEVKEPKKIITFKELAEQENSQLSPGELSKICIRKLTMLKTSLETTTKTNNTVTTNVSTNVENTNLFTYSSLYTMKSTSTSFHEEKRFRYYHQNTYRIPQLKAPLLPTRSCFMTGKTLLPKYDTDQTRGNQMEQEICWYRFPAVQYTK